MASNSSVTPSPLPSPSPPLLSPAPAFCDQRLGVTLVCVLQGVSLEDAHIFWSFFAMCYLSIAIGLLGKLAKRSVLLLVLCSLGGLTLSSFPLCQSFFIRYNRSPKFNCIIF